MLIDVSVNFASSECVFNILSKAVLSSKASADILDHVEIGKNMYEQFVENRIKGSTPLWEKMKKRNLKTFHAQSKVVRCKLNDKIVKIKEERSLITRFLIMSRQRKEIDLKRIIGCYELSVVPPALFLQDRMPHPCLDKHKVTPLHNLQSCFTFAFGNFVWLKYRLNLFSYFSKVIFQNFGISS